MQQRRASVTKWHLLRLWCVYRAFSFERWRVQDWSVDRRGFKFGGGQHRESIKLLSGLPGMCRDLALSRLRVIRH